MKKTPAFRLGRFGAAEAHLYKVCRFADSSTNVEPVRVIAALSILEAIAYLAKAEPDFRVRSVTHEGLVVMLSGSPHA